MPRSRRLCLSLLGVGLLSGALLLCQVGQAQLIPAQRLKEIWSGGSPRGTRGIEPYRAEAPVAKLGEKALPFETGAATLLPEAAAQLEEVARAMLDPELAPLHFVIVGHADPRGDRNFNLKLSAQRAAAVQRFLQARGVAPERLTVKAFGDKYARGVDESTWALDRRVDILTRDYFETYLAGLQEALQPALAADWEIFRLQGGRPVKLDANGVLASGDKFRLYLRPRQNCHARIFQVDAAGRVEQLFPLASGGGSLNNPVSAGQIYWIPGFSEWFVLDAAKGEETLILVLTSQAWPEGDQLPARFRRKKEPVEQARQSGSPGSSQLAQEVSQGQERRVRGVAEVIKETTVSAPDPGAAPPGPAQEEFASWLKKSLPPQHKIYQKNFQHE